MRFAFTQNRKDIKPRYLTLILFPRDVSVFHLSFISLTPRLTNWIRQANSFALFISVRHSRIKRRLFLYEEFVAMG